VNVDDAPEHRAVALCLVVRQPVRRLAEAAHHHDGISVAAPGDPFAPVTSLVTPVVTTSAPVRAAEAPS
jgi:hypothetical protein